MFLFACVCLLFVCLVGLTLTPCRKGVQETSLSQWYCVAAMPYVNRAVGSLGTSTEKGSIAPGWKQD